MATSYTITVNNKAYDVTVEKKGVSTPVRPVITENAVSHSEVAAAKMAPSVPKAPAASSSPNQIIAPMPGKVIAVKVANGDAVKKGQEIMVVEAMKMHNPILAPGDGVVGNLYVKEGDPIQTGQTLVEIKV